MDYQRRLYQVLHPNQALIASQLEPAQFARHYQVRSAPQRAGKLIFAQIDSGFRADFLNIDEAFAKLVPHEDGSPKRTKFVTCYRSLEHIDLAAIRELYLAAPDGALLQLDSAPYREDNHSESLRIFAEICPLSMLVLTQCDASEFGRIIVAPEYKKGAPVIFFTRVDIDPHVFLDEFEANPFMPSPISNLHPSRLRDAVSEIEAVPNKTMKGLSLTCALDEIPYKRIKPGFWFVSRSGELFFPMPSMREIELRSFKFWRSM